MGKPTSAKETDLRKTDALYAQPCRNQLNEQDIQRQAGRESP